MRIARSFTLIVASYLLLSAMVFEYEKDYGGVWDAQKLFALTKKELSALAFEYNVFGGGKVSEF